MFLQRLRVFLCLRFSCYSPLLVILYYANIDLIKYLLRLDVFDFVAALNVACTQCDFRLLCCLVEMGSKYYNDFFGIHLRKHLATMTPNAVLYLVKRWKYRMNCAFRIPSIKTKCIYSMRVGE